jgi:drug/metabolite transporter (DMT)-like permease
VQFTLLIGSEHLAQVMMAFFYIAIPVNVVACLVQGILVKKCLESQISSFMLFRPILSFVIAAYFLSEPLTAELLIAALIVGVGVVLIFCGDSIFTFCKKLVRK